MYSYLFNISSKWSSEPIVTILLKGEDRFKPFKSIFAKDSGEQAEWKANEQALYDTEDSTIEQFFCWLERQYGNTPYMHIRRCGFTPFEFYYSVKNSSEFDIAVETNEPVEDFGNPGTYFHDMYDPNVVY